MKSAQEFVSWPETSEAEENFDPFLTAPKRHKNIEVRDTFWDVQPEEVSFARLDAVCAAQLEKKHCSGNAEEGERYVKKEIPCTKTTSRESFSRERSLAEETSAFQREAVLPKTAAQTSGTFFPAWRKISPFERNVEWRRTPVPKRSFKDHLDQTQESFPPISASLLNQTPRASDIAQSQTNHLERKENGADDISFSASLPPMASRVLAQPESPKKNGPWEEAVQAAFQTSQARAEERQGIDLHQKLFEADPTAVPCSEAEHCSPGVEANLSYKKQEPAVSANKASVPLSQSAATPPIPPATPIRKRSLFSSDAFLTITLAAGVLLLCVLLLWAVSRKNAPITEAEEEPVVWIPSPAAIKVRPEEPKKPLIPYQDELIYGELDPREKNDTQEHILPSPSFAPELVIEQEPSEDEYLDDVLGAEEEAAPPAALQVPAKSSQKAVVQKETASAKPSQGNSARLSKQLSSSSSYTKSKTSPKGSSEKRNPPAKVEKFTAAAHVAESTAFYVQLGILPSVEVARKESARLVAKYPIFAKNSLVVRPVKTDGGRTIYRLLVGPFATKEQAEMISKSLGMKFKILP